MTKAKISNFINKICRLLCHQKKNRCLVINGYRMPICARCTGIIISFIVTLILLAFDIHLNIYIAIVLFIPLALDWGLQAINVLQSTNIRRLITGLVGGLGMCYLFYYIITALLALLKIK